MMENSKMMHMYEKLGKLKLIPVVVIDDSSNAAPLGRALVEGGLPCAEVTFRTPAAADAISSLAASGNILVGAGTVLSIDQVKEAVDCGAKFIVSPGFNPQVVGYCLDNSIPVIPGVCTPTEIETALGFGLEVVKFFPAETFGGLSTLKAISGPYGMMKFIPTGGINANNLVDYLEFEKVLACGGSWIVKKNLLASKNFEEITYLTKYAVSLTEEVQNI